MSTSEKYISEVPMKDKPKIPIGLFLRDKSVTTRKLADEAVTEEKLGRNSVSTDKIQDRTITNDKIESSSINARTIEDYSLVNECFADESVDDRILTDSAVITDKIADHNVTFKKLTPEVQDIIKASSGVSEDLVTDMEKWNDRIAILESESLDLHIDFAAYNTNVIEWTGENTHISINSRLYDKNGSISRNSDYTAPITIIKEDNGQEQFSNYYNKVVVHTFSIPNRLVFTARGTAKYKGVDVTFPSKTLVIDAVLPSYIGYLQDISQIDTQEIQDLTKLVKSDLSGSYNVTNNFDTPAYLVVAVPIPSQGNVGEIHKIVQHGVLDVTQTLITKDDRDYTYYICSTRHNPGTYNFIIS